MPTYAIRSSKNQFSYLSGLLSELLVILFLLRKNYIISGWRYKNIFSEIDIIAVDRKSTEIVFVEVKYRASLSNHLETISFRSQQKICKSAELFLSENYPKYSKYFVRFDAFFINAKSEIHQIENAWQLMF